MTWLNDLQLELENLDGKPFEPNNEVKKDEHVVGIADPDVRKLYSLAMQWQKSSMETAVAARFINKRNEQEESFETAAILQKKSELLMEIFWVSLKEAFNLWDKSSIGVREGWKVVWSEPEMPQIGDILGGLFSR
jgi:hypothetical protein